MLIILSHFVRGFRLNKRTWPVDNESELLSRNLVESSLLLFAAAVVSVLVSVPCLENSNPPGTSSTTVKKCEFLSVGNRTVSVFPASCTAVSRPSDSNKTESVNKETQIWHLNKQNNFTATRSKMNGILRQLPSHYTRHKKDQLAGKFHRCSERCTISKFSLPGYQPSSIRGTGRSRTATRGFSSLPVTTGYQIKDTNIQQKWLTISIFVFLEETIGSCSLKAFLYFFLAMIFAMIGANGRGSSRNRHD